MNTRNTMLPELVPIIGCLLVALAYGDQPPQNNEPQCAGDGSPWRDFDFFIGDWDVIDPDSGQRYGRNTLVMSEQGCLLMGRWVNINGGTGTSMNFYDPLKKQWRQIWQSAPAMTDQTGGLDDQGRMQMEGQIYYHATGLRAPFRGTWSPIGPDRFLQEFWQYDVAEDQWNLWFRGEYRRIDEPSSDERGMENAP